MSRTIEIIPRVKVQGIPIIDLATQEESFTSIDNLFGEAEKLEITIAEGENPADAIRRQVREEIIIRLEAAKNDGVGLFKAELDGSPPVIIIVPDGVAQFVDNQYGTWGGITAEYYVARTGSQVANPEAQSFITLDRIFLSAPPSIKYDTCEYFTPSDENLLTYTQDKNTHLASCGFQYFYQNFSEDKNFKKFVKTAERKEQKLPDGTKASNSFDKIKWYCENNPPQYEEWLLLYKDFMKKKNLDNCIIKPIELEDYEALKEVMPEIKLIDLVPPKYREGEIYNSMSIENIVKLCMWMKLNLMVFDEFGDLMLCYDKNNEYHGNKKTKGGKVVVKIVDNHGYFISKGDTMLHKFCAGGKHGWGGFYPSTIDGEIDNGDYAKDTGVELPSDDCPIIKHPKAMFKQLELHYDWECLMGFDGEPTQEDFEKIKETQEYQYLQGNPPPTPQELIGMMETGAIYYVGKSNLNGIVDYLHKYHNIKPNNLRGLPTAIHKATYGKLKLYAYHQHPTTGYKYPEDLDGKLSLNWQDEYPEKEKECFDKWKEDFPTLKKYAIPTASVMGKAVFDSLKLECYSRMNDKTRNIFFQGETKPDFRKTEPTHNWACAFSLDFSKAYSNAARFMDTEWSVLDAIDEPKQFRDGKLEENAFYLCEELDTGFPYKDLKGKGLALYHGCLLRHLAGKVKPRFIINSHKKIPKDYFVEFVDKCIELAGDGSDNVVSAKQLVNTTFGAIKNKGGIKDYKLYINSDVVQLTKSFAQGLPVFNLDCKKRWKGSSFITAKGTYQHHFLTGQPIRLQIMERINELNLLLDSAVRTSLNKDIHLLLVKTDALYYQYPNNCQYELKDYYWQQKNFNFDPRKDLDLEDINSKLPEGYDVKLERPTEDFGKPVEIRHSWTSAPDTLNQLPIPKFRQKWRNIDTKFTKWDKNEVKTILDKYYKLGGLYCRGEGGVGKTEIIKGIDEICARNRIKLRWLRAFYKIVDRDNLMDRLAPWRETHPCFAKKLAPTNKACNNIGGKTLHRGLGLKVCGGEDSDSDDEEEEEEVKTDFDRVSKLVAILEKNPPDIIPVDEISMIGGEGWSVLSYIKYRIPSIKFFLFGDIKRQLPPVGEERRKFEDSICMKELSNYNKLELKYNFRRQTADTNTLWELCSDKPEVFKISDSPLTYRNLCWTNKTRKEVIDKIQNLHPNPQLWLEYGKKEDPNNTGQNERLMLAVGTPLIARKSIKDKEVAKNEIWKVKSIKQGEIVLEFKDREETFTTKDILKKWLSAYCITIHKSQGDTFTDEYTIWDWDRICKRKDLQAKKLRYTAVSRSVNYEELVKFK